MIKNKQYLKAYRDGFNEAKSYTIRDYKTKSEYYRTIIAVFAFGVSLISLIIQSLVALHFLELF